MFFVKLQIFKKFQTLKGDLIKKKYLVRPKTKFCV